MAPDEFAIFPVSLSLSLSLCLSVSFILLWKKAIYFPPKLFAQTTTEKVPKWNGPTNQPRGQRPSYFSPSSISPMTTYLGKDAPASVCLYNPFVWGPTVSPFPGSGSRIPRRERSSTYEMYRNAGKYSYVG